MVKFITGKDLEEVVYEIIWGAERILLIVSPFIKLDNYFKRLFDKHVNNPKIHILIVFGKNEQEISRSLSKYDFDYFKKFLNISIVYVPNLHAKYYGNEDKGLVTSINLYDYSFKNNIEFGVYSEVNILNKFTTTSDDDAFSASMAIAESNQAIFIKRPVYEKKLLSAFLGKNYIKSDILHDVTDNYYSPSSRSKSNYIKTLNDFPLEIELGSEQVSRPKREEVDKPSKGYCIRTGEEIGFNLKKPFSYTAYQTWASFGDENYPEKYCHKTGKRSNGKTSMKNPIL